MKIILIIIFDFEDYRKPKIYSSITRQECNPINDIDENDFISFKRGYTVIQRVLLRIRHFPSYAPSIPNVDEKINFMIKVCLENMSSILLYIFRSTEHMKLDKQQFMGVTDELVMNSGISAESTPTKTDNSRKGKIKLDPNETQGPEMGNPLKPIYKPGPSGDNTDNRSSSSNDSGSSTETSPKKRKITPKNVSEENWNSRIHHQVPYKFSFLSSWKLKLLKAIFLLKKQLHLMALFQILPRHN